MGTSPAAPSTPQTEAPSVGQLIAGKYRVEHMLGAGGMGVVVAAQHLQLGQLVALKLLRPRAIQDPTAIARFVREARAIAALRSEHAVRIMDVGTLDDGVPYLVMEHLEGATLSAVRREQGQLPPAEAVDYLLQACDALAEAHALGIVHRDLKPANMFVTRRHDGSALVKVLDFGVSKFMTPDPAGSPEEGLTETGMIVGSPEYISPEQVRSSRRADTRSDIWSLGVTLYHLVSGVLPFRAPTIAGLFVAITHDRHPPLQGDGDPALVELNAVIGRCLEKDPDRRYQTVGELVRALLPFAPDGSRAMAERLAAPLRERASPSDAPTALIPKASPEVAAPAETLPTVSTSSAWIFTEARRRSRRVVVTVLAALAAGVLLLLAWAAADDQAPAPAGSVAASSAPLPTETPAASIAPPPVVSASAAPSAPPSSSARPKAPRPGRRGRP